MACKNGNKSSYVFIATAIDYTNYIAAGAVLHLPVRSYRIYKNEVMSRGEYFHDSSV